MKLNPKAIRIFGAILAVCIIVILVFLLWPHKSTPKPTPAAVSTTNYVVITNLTESVLRGLPQSIGKEYQINGEIVKNNNNYFVAGNGDDTGLLQLDFSKIKVNTAQLISKSSTKTVTTGKLAVQPGSNALVLDVQSISLN